MSTVATLPSGCAAPSFLFSDDLEHKIASFHGYQVFNNKINLISIIINIDFVITKIFINKNLNLFIRVYQLFTKDFLSHILNGKVETVVEATMMIFLLYYDKLLRFKM
uniref:Uncharacterized protein n=1 Tax=Glossina austeni TaxID=7395 RepID=A0A1A9VRB2_GLOAU